MNGAIEEVGDLLWHGTIANQFFKRERAFGEFPDGDQRAINGNRGDSRVHTRAVQKACIDKRLGFIHPATDGRYDPVYNAQQVVIVAKANRGGLQLAVSLDIYLLIAIDQDIGDGLVFEEWFDRAKAGHLVINRRRKLGDFGGVHGNALFPHHFTHETCDLISQLIFIQLVEERKVNFIDQPRVNPKFCIQNVEPGWCGRRIDRLGRRGGGDLRSCRHRRWENVMLFCSFDRGNR